MLPSAPTKAEPPLRFRHAWRSYQEEILRDFAAHLGDRHFHIVAAPGSGKTVLGLEAVRLLDKPALVFAPTIVVREQWIDRLRRDFTDLPPDAPDPEWLSRDPLAPACLTFSTYQALSVIYRRKEEDAFLRALHAAGVEVLVADEAHHLRAVWWKCLGDLKRRLGDPIVISLTATPPYDVPQSEWNNYATFCGEIDAEVTAPELVAAGSLCAHQDRVHLCVPSPGEAEALAEHGGRVERLFLDFRLDSALAEALFELPVFHQVERSGLLDALEFHLAAVLYFTECHGRIPPSLREAFPLDGIALPAFDLPWLAHLLTGLFFGPGEPFCKVPALEAWRQRLHETGLLHRRKILFEPPEERERALARSVRKLDAVAEILTHEAAALGRHLRAVVLCDQIRERDFPSGLAGATEQPFVRLGVVPAFETVRRLRLPEVLPGILTGTLIVIPATRRAHFVAGGAAVGIPASEIGFSAIPHDPDFLKVTLAESNRHAGVGVMTGVFHDGEITALFGTAALLGEGWDAPAVNTLVIASTIGSYVMSNQMRGRAIRALREDAEKTANIWHLAVVSDHDRRHAGGDVGKLRRRFEAFAGLVAREAGTADEDDGACPAIENGLARLGVPEAPTEAHAPHVNALMFARAEGRDHLRREWMRAVIAKGPRRVRPVREIAVTDRRLETAFSARFRGRRFWARIHRWLVARRLRGIARAVFRALRAEGHLAADCPEQALVFRHDERRCLTGLAGRPAREQALFSQALAELFNPLIHKPRYLLVTGGTIHCVPSLFGAGKAKAIQFSRHWKRSVGRAHLVYVSSETGREHLLRLREKALLTHLDFATTFGTRWT